MDPFKEAAKLKLRFASPVGPLTTEQLFDLPLTTANSKSPSLDDIYRGVSKSLREMNDDSLLETKNNPQKKGMQLQQNILRLVIEEKLEAAAAAVERKQRAELRDKIEAAIADKSDQALRAKTLEELQQELARLR
jgi:predicted DNA-binding protein